MAGLAIGERRVDRVTVEPSPSRRRTRVPPMSSPMTRVDWCLAAALAAGVLVVHSWSYAAHNPYWVDEAWVADLTRAPLGTAISNASSTPIGWLLLLRAIPGSEPPLRLVPFAFSAASVVAAFVLARRLPWPTLRRARVAAIATAAVVLLAPIALVRDDLKQYTADGCLTLVLLVLVARVDEAPSPRRHAQLAAGVVIATLFSTVAALVGAAAFAAVIVTAFVRRDGSWRAALGAAAAAAAFVVIWFLLVLTPRDTPALHDFWRNSYLDADPATALRTAAQRLSALAPHLAMPAIVFVAVVVLGSVVCAQMRCPALGLVVPLLWLEMFVVGALKRYPFLDARTSHFLLLSSLAIATIGVVAVLARITARRAALGLVLGIACALAFVRGAEPYVRAQALPNQDVRALEHYIEQHRAPGDVVVVSAAANWAFSYYSSHAIDFVKDARVANGFVTRARGLDGVWYVPTRSAADITQTLRDAIARRGPAGRLWIVRVHALGAEIAAWTRAQHTLDLAPAPIFIAEDPLLVVEPGSPDRPVGGAPRR